MKPRIFFLRDSVRLLLQDNCGLRDKKSRGIGSGGGGGGRKCVYVCSIVVCVCVCVCVLSAYVHCLLRN